MQQILGDGYRVLSLDGIGCREEIVEDGDTLEANSMIKARYVKERYGYDCIADDTGLEVDALGGEPGVRSARYAGGDGHDSQANMKLLLERMKGVDERTARFRTVITLIEGDGCRTFTGTVEGVITREPRGEGGFGYDPVFEAEDTGLTFAQMPASLKNSMSHRGRATRALAQYLER